jgi:ankyrin repeat protein
MFLDKGVPIESTTIKSKTALHIAATSGHAEVVRTLVERGTSLELKSHKGETSLHLATRSGRPQVVELLLSVGANRDALTNKSETPFKLAQSRITLGGKKCRRILQNYGLPGY